MNEVPKKLKKDAILEAILELRFETDDESMAELTYGALARLPEWKAFRIARLPTADIPAQMRQVDPNVRYLPAFELTSPDGRIVVRIGRNMFLYSCRSVYPGWQALKPSLMRVVAHLFATIPNVKVTRIGMRYVNALRSDAHGVSGVQDLSVKSEVAGTPITNSINLNFRTTPTSGIEIMSRIATVDLAEGAPPENTTVLVDIDVSTPAQFSTADQQVVERWVVDAHEEEKKNFFKILGIDLTERLRDR